MPKSEHRELPPDLIAEPVELDLAELARIKAKITASDPLVKTLKGDRA